MVKTKMNHSPHMRDPNLFFIGKDNRLYLNRFPKVSLYNKDGSVKDLWTLPKEYGNAIREDLGFGGITRTEGPTPKTVGALQKANNELRVAGASNSEETIVKALQDTRQILSEPEVDEWLSTKYGLPLREFRGFDKVMQTRHGEYLNQQAKAADFRKDAAHRKAKVAEARAAAI
jgi:hypothetical protein